MLSFIYKLTFCCCTLPRWVFAIHAAHRPTMPHWVFAIHAAHKPTMPRWVFSIHAAHKSTISRWVFAIHAAHKPAIPRWIFVIHAAHKSTMPRWVFAIHAAHKPTMYSCRRSDVGTILFDYALDSCSSVIICRKESLVPSSEHRSVQATRTAPSVALRSAKSSPLGMDRL